MLRRQCKSLFRFTVNKRFCSGITHQFGSHCGWCGNKFSSREYPKECGKCKNTTFSNPLPVVVGVIYKNTGHSSSVLCIRRGIEPCKGQLALIGGFLESGETWQTGLSREIQEEVGVDINPNNWKLQDVFTVLKPPRLIISAVTEYPKEKEQLDTSFVTEEVQEILWVDNSQSVELCFDTHNTAIQNFWKEQEQYLNKD